MNNFYAAPSFACQRDHNYKTNFDISRINFFFFCKSGIQDQNYFFFFFYQLRLTITPLILHIPDRHHVSVKHWVHLSHSLSRASKNWPLLQNIFHFNLFLLHHESPTLSLIMFHSVFHLMY